MSGRERILARLRAAAPGVAEPGGLAARFAENLAAAGGRVAERLEAIEGIEAATRVHSALASVPSRGDLSGDLRAAAELDFALLRGAPAVAESGAVWWAPRDAFERAAGFLAEHVVFAVPRDAVVGDLHDAYAQLAPASSAFGCFVCGPSKTADIEQALVIGAHGPRALTVVLTDG